MSKIRLISFFMFAIALASCASTGEKVGDSVVKFFLKTYVGKDYAQIASATRFTNNLIPTKVKVIGKKLSEKKLASGNTQYLHLVPQEEKDSGGFSLDPMGLIKLGSTHEQRYDIYAFLVNPGGKITDYGHGRYNTEKECSGVALFGLEKCSAQEITAVSSEVEGLVVTSSGQSLSFWK